MLTNMCETPQHEPSPLWPLPSVSPPSFLSSELFAAARSPGKPDTPVSRLSSKFPFSWAVPSCHISKAWLTAFRDNLSDEQAKVRTVTALAIAALAEAANPYGIESFDEILNPLWTGARKQRGKGLAGFLEGRWLHHSSDGRRICQLLHQSNHGNSSSGVLLP